MSNQNEIAPAGNYILNVNNEQNDLQYTVNPQKMVRLSFPTLVFLVRLSFEVF